jgi:hypothetical protein
MTGGPEEVLAKFLAATMTDKVERFVGFARSPKHQKKILDALYHDFSKLLNRALIVRGLPDVAWDLPALIFRPPRQFGAPAPTLRAAHTQMLTPILVITLNGKYGFYREEDYLDTELLLSTLDR